jgi:hypothetical protein
MLMSEEKPRKTTAQGMKAAPPKEPRLIGVDTKSAPPPEPKRVEQKKAK